MEIDWQGLLDNVVNWFTTTGANAIIKIIVALLILLISFRIVTKLTRRIEKRLVEKGKLDKTIVKTLFYIARIALKIVIVACLIGYLGIDTSGLTALIASLGVAAGLALNGALSNLAGGVIILVNRPFRVDDYIEACGVSGTVEDIHIITTKIRTPDNKVIYLPNGTLSAGTIINYSEKDLRRVDLVYSIAKTEDYKRAESVILQAANAHEKVLKDPIATARIDKHTANDMQIVLKAWVKSENYWDVYFDLQENVKTALDNSGIVMPANQLEVKVKKD